MRVEITGAAELIADFEAMPGKVQRASIRAMNRAIASGRTVMVRAIAQDVGIKSTDVRTALRMREASVARPTAELAASLKRIPLMKFNARQTTRGGVSYKLRGGRGRLPQAFIRTMRSGHTGVFTREPGAKRLPIREHFGPSLGRVFAKYRGVALLRAKLAFEKNFDHELDFQRSQVSGGGAD